MIRIENIVPQGVQSMNILLGIQPEAETINP